MEKNIKVIIIGVVILAVIASLIFVSFKIEGPGTLIGGLAVLWAGMKSKIFGKKTTEEKIEQIKADHNLKREEWETARQEYDAKFRLLQAKMQYIDYKSALLSEKINHLDDYQKQKLEEIDQANSDQLLEMLNERP
ncbi:hypothetical protein [Sunxiuqinia elliptica]|uniref:Uncharacterized protein n=1 Tax=Sunxiuqinia elliptica TaxID=655355 RepID=A0A4R6GYU5_9BACT|nr:hypothetical protein [Sunxiuqinia elliptica]TDO00045.1 hypothetical protein DET52_106258 [Sunxiuqinia elliptica]TDO57236.1 hypothetical protein DET65_3822 [Sunxiuqinia elliptica]